VRWLIDEMLPPATATELNGRGHDAVSVHDIVLAGADDTSVFASAVGDKRTVVTENFADFAALLEIRLAAGEPCVPVVFVRKTDLPRRGALAVHLAERLDSWSKAEPEPYVGPHWLPTPRRGD
jgi:predicted nuclease of predicted toxin-antitoxin system